MVKGKASSSSSASGGGAADTGPKVTKVTIPEARPIHNSIFGAWTGKIPTVLLYEQTRRNGWEKPEYHCFSGPRAHGGRGGLTRCKVTLNKMRQAERISVSWTPEWPTGPKVRDPGDPTTPPHMPSPPPPERARGKGGKRGDGASSPSSPPSSATPSPSQPPAPAGIAPKSDQEAKQFAATFVLHRICSHIRLDRMLPPAARDYWNQLEEEKRAVLDPQRRALLYSPDPFEAQATHERLVREAQQAHQRREGAAAGAGGVGAGGASAGQLDGAAPIWPPHRYPKLHCPEEHVERMEMLLKSADMASRHKRRGSGDEPEVTGALGRVPVDGHHATLFGKWVAMGFQEAHVLEGLQHRDTSEGLLEWLLLHVPREELPERYRGRGAFITASHAAHTSALTLSPRVKRLMALGFPAGVVVEAMHMHSLDESPVIHYLTQNYLVPCARRGDPEEQRAVEGLALPFTAEELDDELQSLEAMFGDALQSLLPGSTATISGGSRAFALTLTLEPQTPVTLELHLPADHDYPASIPGLLLTSDRVPAHLLMRGMRALAAHAQEMRGQLMLYSLIDWVEREFAELLRNPPSLLEASDEALLAAQALGKLDMMDAVTSALPRDGGRGRRGGARKGAPDPGKSKRMLDAYLRKLDTPALQAFMERRRALPAYRFREHILNAVTQSQVTLICGETGCGKSTQTGQFLLEQAMRALRGAETRILCTQPRRLSATALAQRVAEERCEPLGESVGYVIKGESVGPDAPLVFMTTGVLLRLLIADPDLERVTHIVMDEVHERGVDSDFLLVILRDLLARRPTLKLVLMSATIDAELFSTYFHPPAPVLHIPGFLFHVAEHYLEDIIPLIGYRRSANLMPDTEWQANYAGLDKRTASLYKALEECIDYDLIAQLVRYIDRTHPDDPGSILIFLPGVGEIDRCIRALETLGRPPNGGESDGDGGLINKLELLPLHANLPNKVQSRVFRTFARGVRKVVVSTNVAETSITISDVVYVIDAGKVKEMRQEQGLACLVETWASKASCRQRRGRAGRVKEGHVFRLFTQLLEARDMPDASQPEMVRMPLEQVCLQVRALGFVIPAFLAQAISPPTEETVRRSVQALVDLGALQGKHDELTPLGQHLSQLPVDLRIGKMLLYGAFFQVLDPILTIAAAMSCKSPFLRPERPVQGASDAEGGPAQPPRNPFAGELHSDWLAILHAYNAWRAECPSGKAAYNAAQLAFCERHNLAHSVLLSIADGRRQYREVLESLGFRAPTSGSIEPTPKLLKAVLCAGLYPNVARIEAPEVQFAQTMHGSVAKGLTARDLRYYTKEDGRVFHHPSSVNFHLASVSADAPILVYLHKQKTSKPYLMDSTTTSAWAALLFGGALRANHHEGALAVGDRLKLAAAPRIAVLVSGMRSLLDQALAAHIEHRPLPHPAVLQVVRDILSS